MYAVVETGGKQYRVAEGDALYVEKLASEAGSEIALDRVLLVADGDTVQVGRPFVQGARVVVEVEKHGKQKKLTVYKFKRKKNYRRKQGHRQAYTKLVVRKIETAAEVPDAAPVAEEA